MDLLIRPCRANDIPAITAIYADAVLNGTASFEIEPPDEAEMARRREALVEGRYPYLVAEIDGAVLGYAYAGPYRPRKAYGATVEDSVYVHPDAKGRGLGAALLRALIRACEEDGRFRQMIAVVGDSASAASLALHVAQGFRHAGVLEAVGYKHGAWRDTVLMQRPLRDGASSPPGETG
jgi:phosphinothricin acetyltransferase